MHIISPPVYANWEMSKWEQNPLRSLVLRNQVRADASVGPHQTWRTASSMVSLIPSVSKPRQTLSLTAHDPLHRAMHSVLIYAYCAFSTVQTKPVASEAPYGASVMAFFPLSFLSSGTTFHWLLMPKFTPLAWRHDWALLSNLSEVSMSWFLSWESIHTEIIYIFCTSELCLPWRMAKKES